MNKAEFEKRVDAACGQTHDALALVWGELNNGQRKKLLKNETDRGTAAPLWRDRGRLKRMRFGPQNRYVEKGTIMNKLMAKNIQRDLSEAKTVRQSLDAMGRAISVTVGCQLSTGRRQKRLELLSWITLAIVALICFFEFSRTIEADDPGVRVAMMEDQ